MDPNRAIEMWTIKASIIIVLIAKQMLMWTREVKREIGLGSCLVACDFNTIPEVYDKNGEKDLYIP